MEKIGATILVADDNPEVLRFIKTNLQFEGYDTITAQSGPQALEMARQKMPDLIILDVTMPEMDGWQVLSHLKEDGPTRDIPVIILTGVSIREGREKLDFQGIHDFITKPLNPLRLLQSVESALSCAVKKVPVEGGPGRKIGLGIVLGGGSPGKLLSVLTDSQTFFIAAISGPGGMAPDGDIRYYERAADLLGDPAVGLVLDAGGVIDEEFMRLAGEKKVEVLRGASLQAFLGLASEREECRGREKEILRELHLRVKELSILNEMSRILTSPLDLWLLIDRVAHLSARVADADSFAVLVYSEDLEKFVVSNTLGLGDVFKERVKLSLSDSLVEELMTFRKPLVMGRIQDWGISPLIKAAIGEGKKSMANIPLFSKERLLGFITLFSSQSEFQEEKEEMEFLFTLAGQAGIAIENAYLYENTRQKQTLVERLLSKLIQAQEEERKRIAAEIHDTIAQSLVSIHTRVQTCISLLKKAPDKLPSHLEELKNMVADNVKEVRQIIFNLRPSSLDDLGLIPSLENYIKRFEREQGIQVEFMVNNRERLIPAPVETAVFRITQEALTNVKKHSGGSKVLIKLGIEPKALSLRVADDGKGFQWEEVTEKFLRGDTHGLQGMKERISLLGGTFKVITAKGKGCVVSANIPFSRMEEETAAPEMKHAN